MLPRMVVVVVAGLAWTGAAQAAVYRCESGGAVTFSDRACRANAPAFVPAATLSVVPAGPSRDLVADFNARVQRGRIARDGASRAWLQTYGTRKSREESVRRGRVEGRVVKGMNANDVTRVLGEPEQVRREDGKHGASERWSYHGSDGGSTVTMREGEVVGVSTTRGHGSGGRRRR